MKIIGTGLSGLVGSRVVTLLSPDYTFENYSLETGVDITDKDDIAKRIQSDRDATWVFHFAAYTNVQGAEKDRALGAQSPAWKVNVEATQNIVDACKVSGKHLVYVDTDYAFDGTKQRYTEDDAPHPLGWYAQTKSEGAKRVLTMGDAGLVIRISNPYRANPVGKTDFAHKILERLRNGQEVTSPTDQLFVPTFIDDIATAIRALVGARASGIYHVTPSAGISPFDASLAIAKTYGCDMNLVKPTTFQEFFAGRAPVPRFAVLSNDKIVKLGVSMHEFASGIAEMHRQEQED